MSRLSTFCTICGYITVYNCRDLPIFQSLNLRNVKIYDTAITAASGSIMNAKLFVIGYEEFPNGTSLCVVARGGPVQHFGYLMQALRFLCLNSEQSLYRNIFRYCRLSTTGRVISTPTRTYDGDVAFELETVSNVNGNLWNWTLRCAYNVSFLKKCTKMT